MRERERKRERERERKRENREIGRRERREREDIVGEGIVSLFAWLVDIEIHQSIGE